MREQKMSKIINIKTNDVIAESDVLSRSELIEKCLEENLLPFNTAFMQDIADIDISEIVGLRFSETLNPKIQNRLI